MYTSRCHDAEDALVLAAGVPPMALAGARAHPRRGGPGACGVAPRRAYGLLGEALRGGARA
eukprot:151274-Alexandrium_andersonii.AAC.1